MNKGLKKEIETLIGLMQISVIGECNDWDKIKQELKQVLLDDRIPYSNKRNLLQIVHTTRALDTSLRNFLDFYEITENANALGKYLLRLRNHNSDEIEKITEPERLHYRKNIADIRNKYLHSAGKVVTNASEVNNLATEMRRLMVRIVQL